MQTHEFETDVRWDELDANGHVNNKIYQSYFDEARVRAMREHGVDFEDLRRRRIGPVITRIELDYRAELKHPERARVISRLERENRFRACFVQTLARGSDSVTVCEARTYWLFLDLDRKRPVALESLIAAAQAAP